MIALAEPSGPGDKVKTDRWDGRRLGPVARGGGLVAIRIPSPTEEAVRELCRSRADMVQDRTRRATGWGSSCWATGACGGAGRPGPTPTSGWLRSQRFDQPAMTQTLGHYLAVVEVRNQAPDAIEADLVAGGSGRRLPGRWPGAAPTAASPRLGALTLAAEVGGGRHMASANAFLGFLRADPSEYSSGSRVHRGRLTKAGNAHLWAQLVESA